MTINPTLEHVHQVKKIAGDISALAKEIFNETIDQRGCQYNNPGYKRISSLREQLISMHVYLDDVLDRLEWQHYVWTRLKKELGMAGWVLLGIIIGIAFCLPHMTAH